jgi:hypothetical protein
MLEQLLNEIKNGNTTSPATLAERLNTTPQMVEAMLDTLERMGYLRSISTECKDGTCGGCPVAGYCSTSNSKSPRIWILSNKTL